MRVRGLSPVTWVRNVNAVDIMAVGHVLMHGFKDAPSALYEADELGADAESLGRDIVRSARIDGCVLLLAEVGVTPVAVARVSPRELVCSRHVATVALCVAPAWRGRGIGRTTLEAAERRAFTELEVERLELKIASDDTVLRRLAEGRRYRCERAERRALVKDGVRADLLFYVRNR